MKKKDFEQLAILTALSNQKEVEHVPYEKNVNVNINRQSTSDDARLLKQLEQEAKDKVIAAYIEQAGDNTLAHVRVIVQAECTSLDNLIYGAFSLNGKTYEVRVRAKSNPDRYEGINEIYKRLAERIAEEMLDRHMRGRGVI